MPRLLMLKPRVLYFFNKRFPRIANILVCATFIILLFCVQAKDALSEPPEGEWLIEQYVPEFVSYRANILKKDDELFFILPKDDLKILLRQKSSGEYGGRTPRGSPRRWLKGEIGRVIDP